MKKETLASILVCVLFLGISGWLYLRTEQGSGSGEEQWSPVAGEAAWTAGPSEESPSEGYTVYICGAVRHPGVYQFDAGARICDAVEAAGGFTKKAVQDSVNQARLLVDGEQITIPVKSKRKKASSLPEQGEGLVNINQAELSELMTLPGIGEAKAKLILEYRSQNGGFAVTEDIMKISGIKEGIYNQIKDCITV